MHKFFRMCIEIEEMVAGVYRELAAATPAEGKLKKLWLEMALEEEDHARQIKLAARLPAMETIRKPLIPLQQVEHLHRKVKTLLEQIKGRTISREKALLLSLRVEREFVVVHVHCAVEFVDESMQALFRSLAADDERHAEALATYCREAGIPMEEV